MSKLSINYSPEFVDAAIKEHIQKHMNVTGDLVVEYMHRRKTKKVSATIYIDNMKTLEEEAVVKHVFDATPEYLASMEGVSQGYESASKQPIQGSDEDYETGENTIGEAVEKVIEGDAHLQQAITFDDLPDHEKEEARETQDEIDESNVEDLFA